MTSEVHSGDSVNYALGYTYDHNGNRLTQTSNGTQVQAFTYNGHDVLAGTGGESEVYDLNGNLTSQTVSGQTTTYVWDDEDRMTSLTLPNGTVDSFTYNELGLRTGKTDSTGIYAYVCDGTSPGSPVLSDGVALYTPGLSEYRGGASRYYANDLLGNLWTIDASSKGQLDYQDTTGFGTLVAQAGSGSVFGYGGGNGCQTDADTGLILMGHRYFDTRIGRFITQDPIGDGDNWYSYAGNNPTNKTDPLGLAPMDGPGSSPVGSPGYADGAASGSAGEEYYNQEFLFTQTWTTERIRVNGQVQDVYVPGSYSYTLTPLGSVYGMFPGMMGSFGKAALKEAKMWINYAKFRSQGGARNAILLNLGTIYTGIAYMGSPASGSAGANAATGALFGAGAIFGIGTASAGADMALGGTAAATIYGGAACATGIGAIIVGGAAAGVAGYRASDAWVNTTPSGAWVTDELGGAAYAAGKLFGVYNFILPVNFWKKVEMHTHKLQRAGLHRVAHYSLLHY